MEIVLTVSVKGEYISASYATQVPELYRRAFEPLRTCDEPMLCLATGDAIPNSATVKTVMKTRDDAAKILSEEIANMIVEHMKKHDTHNGYALENNDG